MAQHPAHLSDSALLQVNPSEEGCEIVLAEHGSLERIDCRFSAAQRLFISLDGAIDEIDQQPGHESLAPLWGAPWRRSADVLVDDRGEKFLFAPMDGDQ